MHILNYFWRVKLTKKFAIQITQVLFFARDSRDKVLPPATLERSSMMLLYSVMEVTTASSLMLLVTLVRRGLATVEAVVSSDGGHFDFISSLLLLVTLVKRGLA